ncbi:unnamed protein product, partial [marine sediment metagenome]
NKLNDVLQMQIDIFCDDIAKAVDDWYEKKAKNNPEIQQRIKNLIEVYPVESIGRFIKI